MAVFQFIASQSKGIGAIHLINIIPIIRSVCHQDNTVSPMPNSVPHIGLHKRRRTIAATTILHKVYEPYMNHTAHPNFISPQLAHRVTSRRATFFRRLPRVKIHPHPQAPTGGHPHFADPAPPPGIRPPSPDISLFAAYGSYKGEASKRRTLRPPDRYGSAAPASRAPGACGPPPPVVE